LPRPPNLRGKAKESEFAIFPAGGNEVSGFGRKTRQKCHKKGGGGECPTPFFNIRGGGGEKEGEGDLKDRGPAMVDVKGGRGRPRFQNKKKKKKFRAEF